MINLSRSQNFFRTFPYLNGDDEIVIAVAVE